MREVKRLVRAWQEGRKEGDGGQEVKVLSVPKGMLNREGGVEGLLSWVKGELGRAYGVEFDLKVRWRNGWDGGRLSAREGSATSASCTVGCSVSPQALPR